MSKWNQIVPTLENAEACSQEGWQRAKAIQQFLISEDLPPDSITLTALMMVTAKLFSEVIGKNFSAILGLLAASWEWATGEEVSIMAGSKGPVLPDNGKVH